MSAYKKITSTTSIPMVGNGTYRVGAPDPTEAWMRRIFFAATVCALSSLVTASVLTYVAVDYMRAKHVVSEAVAKLQQAQQPKGRIPF